MTQTMSDPKRYRHVENPAPFLEEAVSSGCSIYLVLDPACDPQAVPHLYATEPRTELTLLFFNSSLQSLHEASPRVAVVSPDASIVRWIEERDPSGWGLLLATPAPIEDVLAHFRSLLLATTDDQEVIFRIWDGRILSRICAAMPKEMPLLLGPVRRVLTRTEDGKWACIDQSEETDFLSRPYAPQPVHSCPWYRFTDEHVQIFRDKRTQVVVLNITETLRVETPGQGLPVPNNESLPSFVSRHVDRALQLGMWRFETLELFVRCCLLHGETFPQNAQTSISNVFARQPFDEDAAIASMLLLSGS